MVDEDGFIPKGAVVRCPECGYEMKVAIRSRGLTCSKGKGLPHRPQRMVEVSTTVESGAVTLTARKRRK